MIKDSDTDKNNIDEAILFLRRPKPTDAPTIYNLVKRSQILDVNSEYCYALIGLHFDKTSIVATINNEVIAFVSGYLIGSENDTLFIWQVAVDQDYRKRGVALKMFRTYAKINSPTGDFNC